MTDLVPRQPDATPAVYDAATLAVLSAMEEAAEKHLDRSGIIVCDVG